MQFVTISMALLLLAAGICTAQTEIDLTPVDQALTDEQVLRLIDTSYPGLEDFAAAMQANDLKRAHELLVRHFTTREKPVLPEAKFPGLSEGNSMIVLRAASKEVAEEKLLKHIFSQSNNDVGKTETYDLGPQIKWMENPSKALSWILYLNQLNVVNSLAGVYQATGEEKFAVEAGNMVATWTEQCFAGYGYTRDGKPTPSMMEVRNRLCNCIAAYEVLRKCPALTADMHMAFWKLFVTHARELMTYEGVAYPGLIPPAVMFPEFSEADEWLAAGARSLRETIVDRVTPEGGWDTHSISYQNVPVPWAMRSLEFLEANAEGRDFQALADMIRTQAEKLMSIMLWLALPNAGRPNIGDSYGRCDWGNSINSILTSYIYSQCTAEQQERLNGIGDPYARMKAALALTEGHDGDEPHATSVGFPGTGYYAMRSGWEPGSARYLYFDLSPQALGHAHWDACHFDLYAYGKPLLCDTGDYFLGWGYRTALHNTIEVDEKVQAWAATMLPCEWLTTSGLDFVDVAHAGYEQQKVIHRRKMAFLKDMSGRYGDYWVLCDLLTGEGSHKYEQFFHFAGPTQFQPAEASLDDKALATRTVHADTANVHVIPAHIEGLGAAFVEAHDTDMNINDKYTREAMLGWMVTSGTFQRVKSPVAVYTREGEPPVSFYDVLFPFAAGEDAQVQVHPLPVTRNGVELAPTQAAGLRIDCKVKRPAHDPARIQLQVGENLAAGRGAFAEINTTAFPSGAEARLTDGNLGATEISAAMSSAPYTPGVMLSGRFGVDFGQSAQVSTVIAHHGTFNGSSIIYPPSKMVVQYWDGAAWQDAANQKTRWDSESLSSTSFDAVTTSRICVAVERKDGGRLAMREIQAHYVPPEELARVDALRAEVTTASWTDYFLISHEGPGPRTCGDLACDGELAFVRKDSSGRIVQASLMRGSAIVQDGRNIVALENQFDYLTARWEGNAVQLDCPVTAGVEVLAQGAQQVTCQDKSAPAHNKAGMLVVDEKRTEAPPTITDATVALHPPQEGLHGAQPWAVVTWKTDTPAQTQVEFTTDDGLLRRTSLDVRPVTDHQVRVEFLRPERRYRFTAVSVDSAGRRAVATVE